MATLLFLNELSCKHDLHPSEINRAMRTFVTLLRAAKRSVPTAGLVSVVKLPNIELSPGYPMSKWCADNHNVDHWRYIRNMQNKAPFTFAEVDAPDDPDEYEYHHKGRLAVGLGIAHTQNRAESIGHSDNLI